MTTFGTSWPTTAGGTRICHSDLSRTTRRTALPLLPSMVSRRPLPRSRTTMPVWMPQDTMIDAGGARVPFASQSFWAPAVSQIVPVHGWLRPWSSSTPARWYTEWTQMAHHGAPMREPFG